MANMLSLPSTPYYTSEVLFGSRHRYGRAGHTVYVAWHPPSGEWWHCSYRNRRDCAVTMRKARAAGCIVQSVHADPTRVTCAEVVYDLVRQVQATQPAAPDPDWLWFAAYAGRRSGGHHA